MLWLHYGEESEVASAPPPPADTLLVSIRIFAAVRVPALKL